jgi:ABC-2 type transport system ATP-binding protein
LKNNEAGRLVALTNVSKRFGTKLALDSINLSAEEGVILGCIGPNGAGKTTALRIIVGTEPNFEGKLTYKGFNEVRTNSLGYMPQHASFAGWRTVDETLSLFARLSGLEGKALLSRTTEILEFVDLKLAKDTRCSTLSGGMVQRLSLAQAIIHQPSLLVLDEPFNHLDPSGRIAFKKMLRYLKDHGQGIIFSSHILSDVEEVANRIAILNRANIVFDGDFIDLRSKHAPKIGFKIDTVGNNDILQDAANFSGVMKTEQTGPNQWEIIFRGDSINERTGNDLLSYLMGKGHLIKAFRAVDSTLEEIFENIVNREP